MRVVRKVKLDGAWIFAPVPMDAKGKPSATHVLRKGERIPVDGGTFYIATGSGKGRKHVTCGDDPEAVRRALRTQAHVMQLRAEGMDVPDAPEIEQNRRGKGDTLQTIVREFQEETPTGLGDKSVKKYLNAFRVFAQWGATVNVYSCSEVTAKHVTKWIRHMQKVEGLDAATIVPKVGIVLGELRRRGNAITLEENTLPAIVERERDIYTPTELQALFSACDQAEYELFQVFLLTGMRYREVAFLGWNDVDPHRCTIRVSRKRDLGFMPKAYHERTIPVPRSLIELLERRGDRVVADGAGLIFPTSTSFFRKGVKKGGKADKKLLEKLKQVARRSGLNCGHCIGSYKGKEVTCRTHAICHRWGLHKFRHTYATSMLRDKVDIVTVSQWLGHKDLATTRIYLRALSAEMAQPQVESSTLAMQYSARLVKPEGRATRRRDTREI